MDYIFSDHETRVLDAFCREESLAKEELKGQAPPEGRLSHCASCSSPAMWHSVNGVTCGNAACAAELVEILKALLAHDAVLCLGCLEERFEVLLEEENEHLVDKEYFKELYDAARAASELIKRLFPQEKKISSKLRNIIDVVVEDLDKGLASVKINIGEPVEKKSGV